MSTVQHAGPSPTRGAGSPACGLALLAVWPVVEGGYTLEERISEAAWCLAHGDVDLLDEDGHPITVDQVRAVGSTTWRMMPAAELAGELPPGSGWEHYRGSVLVATVPAVKVAPQWRRRRELAAAGAAA